MGLSNNDSSQVNYMRMVGLKKDEKEVFFAKNTKQNGEYVLEGKWSKLEGKLKAVKIESRETEKYGVKYNCKIEIVDNAIYVLEVPMGSMIGTSIVNSLCSKEKANDISISLYINKKGYKSVWVELDGEQAKWAMPYEEVNALKTRITDPDTGEVVKTKVDKLMKKLQEMCTLQGNTDAKPTVSLAQATSALDSHMDAPAPQVEEEQDDLPF